MYKPCTKILMHPGSIFFSPQIKNVKQLSWKRTQKHKAPRKSQIKHKEKPHFPLSHLQPSSSYKEATSTRDYQKKRQAKPPSVGKFKAPFPDHTSHSRLIFKSCVQKMVDDMVDRLWCIDFCCSISPSLDDRATDLVLLFSSKPPPSIAAERNLHNSINYTFYD